MTFADIQADAVSPMYGGMQPLTTYDRTPAHGGTRGTPMMSRGGVTGGSNSTAPCGCAYVDVGDGGHCAGQGTRGISGT